jgi:hypothetical protein
MPDATLSHPHSSSPDQPAITQSSDPPSDPPAINIRPWVDAVVDQSGHDPRSRYVEIFWLGVLGPTATWLTRRLVARLEESPEGYRLDLTATAKTMGLSYNSARSSPFSKALQRCVMFGLAHPIDQGLAIRRRIPPVSYRHLQRMPDDVRAAHAAWTQTTVGIDELTRAHRLAMVLLDTGDESSVIEHHLVALGISDAVAAEAADNACQLTNPASREPGIA